MKTVKFSENDILELKKPHPCGNRQFTVLRLGSEVRIKCNQCGRDMTLPREKLEHAIRNLISAEISAKEGDRYE